MKYLIYSFSGELDDVSHLFPNDRLAEIAAIIKESNNEVEIWDRGNIDELIRWGKNDLTELGSLGFYDTAVNYTRYINEEKNNIMNSGFNIILLNLWQGSGFKFSIDLAKAIKQESSSVKIFGIGQKVDWFQEHILKIAPHLDGLMLGLEFESVRQLSSGIELGSIPNLILNNNGQLVFTPRKVIDVNNIPLPAYGTDLYKGIEGKIPLYLIPLSNQACQGKCVFCIRPINYGRKTIRRSIKDVVDEIQFLNQEKNVSCFKISDSTPFPLSLTELSNNILSSGLNKTGLVLSAFARIDVNKNENFDLLKKAGIGALFFGIESLVDKNLKEMKKGTNYKMIRATLKKAHQAGIFTVGCFVFPIPGESQESMKMNMDRLYEIQDDLDSVLALPGGIYPTNQWGLNPEKYNIKLPSDFIETLLIYPHRRLFPVKFLPPLPFAYPLMGKNQDEATHADILEYFDKFINFIRKDLKKPGIPDEYWILAKHFRKDCIAFTGDIINSMINRDYLYIKNLISESNA